MRSERQYYCDYAEKKGYALAINEVIELMQKLGKNDIELISEIKKLSLNTECPRIIR